MIIVLKTRRWYSDGGCGDYDYPFPKTPPLAGAYKLEYTNRETMRRQSRSFPVAKLNSDGEPYIDTETVYDDPPTAWLEKGTHHRTEGNYYVRDVRKFYWALEIETLEQFLELFDGEELSSVRLDGTNYYSATWST
jgi:hypothetical protein